MNSQKGALPVCYLQRKFCPTFLLLWKGLYTTSLKWIAFAIVPQLEFKEG